MKPEIDFLLVVCAIAICTDVRERKIPNWLTGGLAAGGLAFQISHGWLSVAVALVAGSIVFVFGALAHNMRVLGGGDVKLLAAGALTIGFPECVLFVLYTFLGGGILAIVFALAQRRLRQTLVNVRAIAQKRTLLDDAAPSARMPYAIAIAFGAAVVALADTILPAVRFPT